MDLLWEEPSRDVIIKATMNQVFLNESQLCDNVDDIVSRQVQQEEWYFDDDIAEVQFEIADSIVDDLLQEAFSTLA